MPQQAVMLLEVSGTSPPLPPGGWVSTQVPKGDRHSQKRDPCLSDSADVLGARQQGGSRYIPSSLQGEAVP